MTFEAWLLIGTFIAALASFAGGAGMRRRDELAEARRALLGALDVQHQFRERASTELARLELAIGEIRTFQARILERKVVERDMLTRYRASSDVHHLLSANWAKIELLTHELSDTSRSTREHATAQSIFEEAAEWFYRWHCGDTTSADRYAYLQWLKTSPMHVAEFLRASRLYQVLDTLKPLRLAAAPNSSVQRLHPHPFDTRTKRVDVPKSGSLQRAATPLRSGAPIAAMLSVAVGTSTMASAVWQSGNSALYEAFHLSPAVGTAISVLAPLLALIFGAAIGLRAAQRSTVR